MRFLFVFRLQSLRFPSVLERDLYIVQVPAIIHSRKNKMDSEVLQAYFVIAVVTIIVFTASFCAAMKLGDMVARVM